MVQLFPDDPNLDPRVRWEIVERCPCGGKARDAAVWGWGVCESCGTWVNTRRPDEASLKYIYGPAYWTTTQAMAGCPTIESRFESDMHDRIGPYLNALLPHLTPSAIIAETGCGNARFLHELKARGYDVVGTEYSRELIERVAKLTDVTIKQGGVDQLESGTYDAAISIDVMEHVHDPRVFLRDHARVLKPRGTMLIHTPIHDSQAQVYGYSVGMLWKLYHLWLFSRELFERLVSDAGFDIVDNGTVVFGWPVYVLRKRG